MNCDSYLNEIVNAKSLLLEAHEDEKKIINNYSSMVIKIMKRLLS